MGQGLGDRDIFALVLFAEDTLSDAVGVALPHAEAVRETLAQRVVDAQRRAVTVTLGDVVIELLADDDLEPLPDCVGLPRDEVVGDLLTLKHDEAVDVPV